MKTRHFINTKDGHNKFWEVEIIPSTAGRVKVRRRWGKRFTAGQETIEETSPFAAREMVAKLIQQKRDKGYTEDTTVTKPAPKPAFGEKCACGHVEGTHDRMRGGACPCGCARFQLPGPLVAGAPLDDPKHIAGKSGGQVIVDDTAKQPDPPPAPERKPMTLAEIRARFADD